MKRTVRQRVDLSPIPGPALRYIMLIKEQRDEINERVGRTRNRPGVVGPGEAAASGGGAVAESATTSLAGRGAGNGRSEQRERVRIDGEDTDDRGERRSIRARGQRRTRTVRQRNGP